MIHAWMFDNIDEYFLTRMPVEEFEDDAFIGLNDKASFFVKALFNGAVFDLVNIILGGHGLLDIPELALPLAFGQLLLILLQ